MSAADVEAMTRRLAARRRHRGGWGRTALAVLIAAGLNAVLVVVLAELLAHLREQPEELTAVVPVTRIDPVEPPPPPPQPQAPRPEAEPVAPALPPLDLAAPSVDPQALQLPTTELAIDLAELPLAMPAIAAAPAVAAPADGSPAFDRGPELLVVPELGRFYPRRARRRGIEGETTIRVEVDATGRVAEVEVLASEPPGVFEQAALELGSSLRYRAAERDGVAVPATDVKHLVWSLE